MSRKGVRSDDHELYVGSDEHAKEVDEVFIQFGSFAHHASLKSWPGISALA